jgi:hypothetical protein
MTTNCCTVYFIYPETCGVRLEDMDSIFGDASTVMGTPSIRGDETGSLIHGGSPIGSARGFGGPISNIPNLSLDPPEMDDDNKSQNQTGGGEDRSIGTWISRVVGRGRADSSGSGQGRYAPLGQQDN